MGRGWGLVGQTTTIITTTTIISERADPLRPAWGHPTEGQALRASPENIKLLPVSGSPNPRFPPYVVRTLHMHGAPAYGEDTQPEVKMRPRACRGKVRRAPLGDVGGPNGFQAGPFRSPLGDLGGPGCRREAQEAERNRTETCAKRYAQYGLADMNLQKHVNCNICLT